MTSTQSEIRAFLDSRSEAISTGDLDRLMPFYSPDIVYFGHDAWVEGDEPCIFLDTGVAEYAKPQ